MQKKLEVEAILEDLQKSYARPLITKALPFRGFRLNEEKFRCYYESDPKRPFNQSYIEPKLDLLEREHPDLISPNHKNS